MVRTYTGYWMFARKEIIFTKKKMQATKEEKIKSPIQTGERGGKFFIIKQGTDEIKVYVSKKYNH